MKDYSYIFNARPEYIDQVYKNYLADPTSVEDGWRSFFAGFEFASQNGDAEFKSTSGNSDVGKEFDVISIIHGFRNRGHLLSTTNPIRKRRDRSPHLSLADYRLEENDMDRDISGRSRSRIAKWDIERYNTEIGSYLLWEYWLRICTYRK